MGVNMWRVCGMNIYFSCFIFTQLVTAYVQQQQRLISRHTSLTMLAAHAVLQPAIFTVMFNGDSNTPSSDGARQSVLSPHSNKIMEQDGWMYPRISSPMIQHILGLAVASTIVVC